MRVVLICFLVFVLILFGRNHVAAQSYFIKGQVKDSVTHEGLALVTIIMNDDKSQGVFTDEFGNFAIEDSLPINSIQISYIGYASKNLEVENGNFYKIFLAPLHLELNTLEIFSGENPANRIIKEVIKHKYQNDYSNLNSYSYNAYEKFVVNAFPQSDSSLSEKTKEFYEALQQNYLFISESYINQKYLSPDLTKETVLAQKVSGMHNPNFTVLMSEFQSTNFYKPIVTIAQEDYLSPISNESWKQYFFNVEDTFYEKDDTVFVLSFVPAKGKTFQSLQGTVEINSNSYAIENINASPADTAVATLSKSIEQRYAMNKGQWFPVFINLNVGFQKFFINGLPVMMHGITIIDSIIINPPLTPKDFDGISIDMADHASEKDSGYWQQHRLDTLSKKEIQSYQFIDSIGNAMHLDAKVQFANAIQDGILQFPFLSVELNRLLKYDQPEKIRAGFGLETNNRISKIVRIGAWAGYGLKDSLWKKGGFVLLKILPEKNLTLQFTSEQNYTESGGYHFFQEGYFGSNINSRNYTITNFDFANLQKIDFSARIRKYLNIEISVFKNQKTATNQYLFSNSDFEIPQNQFLFSGTQVSFRFSYKEKIVESLGHYYWSNNGYPTFWLQLTRGQKGFLKSDFSYNKIIGRAQYFFQTKKTGIINLTIDAGWIDVSLPASELFSGRSSYAPLGLNSLYSFQTMRSNEFVNSVFASIFWLQDLQRSFFRVGKFQPNIQFATNAGWGILYHPQNHFNALFTDMHKGYFESGLVANNLIAKKIGGVVRLGFGVSLFYRYGAYHLTKESDNYSLKLSFSYNFN